MNALIVYFSCYGEVEKFAYQIMEITGADIFKLEPVNAYDSDISHYDNLTKMVKAEKDKGILPDIKKYPDVSSYDYIFLGYPIWWYEYPQVIKRFIRDVDLSGKVIIPFNTHEGSGDGGTYKVLQDELKNSKVLMGLPIRGDNMKYDQKGNIKEWLDSLKVNF